MKRLFKRKVNGAPEKVISKFEEGVRLTYSDAGEITNIELLDGFGNVTDIDGNVQNSKSATISAIQSYDASTELATVANITPDSTYTSMKSVSPKLKLHQWHSAENPAVIHINSRYVQSFATPSGYCGIYSLSLKTDAIFADFVQSTRALTTDTNFDSKVTADTYPAVVDYKSVPASSDVIHYYGTLTVVVDSENNTITQTLKSDTAAGMLTAVRSSSDSGENWTAWSVELLYGTVTVDSVANPTTATCNTNLDKFILNGNYPVIVTDGSTTVYGNLDVTVTGTTNINHTIIYGVSGKHVTVSRNSTDTGATWDTCTVTAKDLQA